MWMIMCSLAAASSLVQDSKTLDLKFRPVSKVLKLLHDMKAELEQDGANDQSVYDKLACWCETNNRDKSTATATANKQITQLVTDIQKYSAKSAELKASIAQIDKEVAANKAALEKATAVREKEAAEFQEDDRDMLQSIQALKNAVFVLSKHHESFLQMPAHSFVEVRTAAERVLRATRAAVAPSQRKALSALVQQPNANAGSYNSQSGAIFGILKQMKEEFESNLSEAQKTEQQGQSDYDQLKAAKEAEISAGVSKGKQHVQTLAATKESLADAKENLAATREALSADTQFLQDLKLRCNDMDAEFAERQKVRSQEIAAVSEAVKILSEDDARDNFSKTLNFLQRSDRRSRGAAVLRAAGLTKLAQRAQFDVFGKIRASIDEMVADLKKTQTDEVAQKDDCDKQLRDNEVASNRKQRDITELGTFIEEATQTIATLSKEIETHHAEVAEMQKQMKQASQDREAENKEFQDAVTEQRAAQDVLHKALARLEVFYKKKDEPSLVQAMVSGDATPGAAAPPEPKGFDTYENNRGASGVMGLIQNIIDDAAEMEKDALKAETDAQASYEDFIKNSNDSVKTTENLIAKKSDQKADTTAAKVGAEADRRAALEDAERLQATNADLHASCDFLIKNFEVRQAARTQELEALAEAKATFSGADFSF
jgi:hypothetical protein